MFFRTAVCCCRSDVTSGVWMENAFLYFIRARERVAIWIEFKYRYSITSNLPSRVSRDMYYIFPRGRLSRPPGPFPNRNLGIAVSSTRGSCQALSTLTQSRCYASDSAGYSSVRYSSWVNTHSEYPRDQPNFRLFLFCLLRLIMTFFDFLFLFSLFEDFFPLHRPDLQCIPVWFLLTLCLPDIIRHEIVESLSYKREKVCLLFCQASSCNISSFLLLELGELCQREKKKSPLPPSKTDRHSFTCSPVLLTCLCVPSHGPLAL